MFQDMVKQIKMNSVHAQEIAMKSLHFIAGNEDYLGSFLATTGLGPGNLREAARDPNFLNAILTFVSEDEQRLLACAAAIGSKPEDLSQAYDLLVGHYERDMP